MTKLRPSLKDLEALGWRMLWKFVATFGTIVPSTGILAIDDVSTLEGAGIAALSAAMLELVEFANRRIRPAPAPPPPPPPERAEAVSAVDIHGDERGPVTEPGQNFNPLNEPEVEPQEAGRPAE